MNCGKELEADEAYCKKCGLPIPGRANKLKDVPDSENALKNDEIDSKLKKYLILFILSGLFGFYNVTLLPGLLYFLLCSALYPIEKIITFIFKILLFNNISICILVLLNVLSLIGIVMLAIKNPQRKGLRIIMAIVLLIAVAIYIAEIFKLTFIPLFV